MTVSTTRSMPKMGRGARKSLSTDPTRLVSFAPMFEGLSMPLVCRPAVSGVSLVEWASQNRALIDSKLLEHAVILFRGFQVADIGEFNRCLLYTSDAADE